MENETTHFGFKKVNFREKQKHVEQVFNSVAPVYDIMNDVMSFGIHRLWKRIALSRCQIRKHHSVLDVAAGTGDLALKIAPLVQQEGHLIVSDINGTMLNIARTRLLDQGFFENVDIVQADAEQLPFATHAFDRIIMGFGLRNVTHKEKALHTLYRILKPGGKLIVLEFSHPTSTCISALYDAYSFRVLPLLGKLIAQDAPSYQYLSESIRMHPNQETLKKMMEGAGFNQVSYQNLSNGIVALHQGIKY